MLNADGPRAREIIVFAVAIVLSGCSGSLQPRPKVPSHLGSKSSALDALECPVQMAHTPAQHVFCHDRHAQWMQAAASVHK